MTSVFLVQSLSQSCLTLCDPMDYSTPGFPDLQHSENLTHICELSATVEERINNNIIQKINWLKWHKYKNAQFSYKF